MRVKPKAVLLDLDGVLYIEEEPIPAAADAVDSLREQGFALRFVTNTTSRSRAATLDKLLRLGFAVEPHELVTPAALAVRYCVERGYRRVSLLMNDEVKQDFDELEQDDRRAQAVIVGDLGERFAYATLNAAFRLLMAGAELVALQKNRYWLREDGLSLDVGPFVAALEYASGGHAYVVGKPAQGFFAEILADLGVHAGEALMVGDDIESDIGGALAARLSAVLVRTGKFREVAAQAAGIDPTATIDSIADLPRLLAARDP
jgi:HAD superfamily hydrolase (TIGR01458 family)